VAGPNAKAWPLPLSDGALAEPRVSMRATGRCRRDHGYVLPVVSDCAKRARAALAPPARKRDPGPAGPERGRAAARGRGGGR
jgi:hypothetical protein